MSTEEITDTELGREKKEQFDYVGKGEVEQNPKISEW